MEPPGPSPSPLLFPGFISCVRGRGAGQIDQAGSVVVRQQKGLGEKRARQAIKACAGYGTILEQEEKRKGTRPRLVYVSPGRQQHVGAIDFVRRWRGFFYALREEVIERRARTSFGWPW